MHAQPTPGVSVVRNGWHDLQRRYGSGLRVLPLPLSRLPPFFVACSATFALRAGP